MDEHRTGTGSGDGNESSSGDGDEDGNEEGIGVGGGEVKKRKKPDNNCRRDQALSFRTHHHLCKQGVALAGTRYFRSLGPVLVYAHRTEGVTRSDGREGANGIGGGIGVEGGNGDGNGDGDDNGAETGTGEGTETRTVVEMRTGDRFTCRIVTYAEVLVSVYICYSTGEWFNTPLPGFIMSTYG